MVGNGPLSEAELNALVSLINDDDYEVRQHVEMQLVNLGTEAIPLLERALETQGSDTLFQDRVIDLVHMLQFQHLLGRLGRWALSTEQDLLEGMVIVASYLYPNVDIAPLRAQIDKMYYEAWLQLREGMHPYDTLRILNQVILTDNQFVPNVANFHSPANSMINEVLATRKGNPISLSVVYLLVAQRLNLPLWGANVPNLFMLLFRSHGQDLYISPYSKGIFLSPAQLESFIKTIGVEPQSMFFEPCSHQDIIRRVLRNLATAFEHRNDEARMGEVQQMLNVLD